MTKTALVTGGNRGIGKAIAERLVSDGYQVAITSRDGTEVAGTLAVVADLNQPESLDAAVSEVESKLGPIELLVANAGITK